MSAEKLPYLRSCPVCGDGQLRLYRCGRCDAIVAICDECELIWRDAAQARRVDKPPSDAAFPDCPACKMKQATWFRLTSAEIRTAGLEVFLSPPDSGLK